MLLQRGKLHGILQLRGVLIDLQQLHGLPYLVQIMKLEKHGIVQIDHCLVIIHIDSGEKINIKVDNKIT